MTDPSETMKRFLDLTKSKLAPDRESTKRRSGTSGLRRGTVCTHVTLTRLYGQYSCTHCNRVPRHGFVYRCTQDTDGELPVNTITLEMEKNSDDSEILQEVQTILAKSSLSAMEERKSDLHSTRLKPWIMRAIENGEYSPEQIEILKAQRSKVEACIEDSGLAYHLKEAYLRYKNSAPSSSASSYSGDPEDDASQEESQVTQPSPKSRKCGYQTCPQCRPGSRDRAWQSYNSVFENEDPMLDIENDNRPISDTTLVRQLGLNSPERPAISDEFRALLTIHDETAEDEWNARVNEGSGDGCSNIRHVREKPRLRRSLREAFRTTRTDSHRSSKSEKSGIPGRGVASSDDELITPRKMSQKATSDDLDCEGNENNDRAQVQTEQGLRKARGRSLRRQTIRPVPLTDNVLETKARSLIASV